MTPFFPLYKMHNAGIYWVFQHLPAQRAFWGEM